jgi:hypothetical protein
MFLKLFKQSQFFFKANCIDCLFIVKLILDLSDHYIRLRLCDSGLISHLAHERQGDHLLKIISELYFSDIQFTDLNPHFFKYPITVLLSLKYKLDLKGHNILQPKTRKLQFKAIPNHLSHNPPNIMHPEASEHRVDDANVHGGVIVQFNEVLSEGHLLVKIPDPGPQVDHLCLLGTGVEQVQAGLQDSLVLLVAEQQGLGGLRHERDRPSPQPTAKQLQADRDTAGDPVEQGGRQGLLSAQHVPESQLGTEALVGYLGQVFRARLQAVREGGQLAEVVVVEQQLADELVVPRVVAARGSMRLMGVVLEVQLGLLPVRVLYLGVYLVTQVYDLELRML